MCKWCFPGNISHIRNADEGSGVSGDFYLENHSVAARA